MAEVIKLVQGSDELDLDDKTSFKTTGLTLNTGQPKTRWHEPDVGDVRLISNEDSDRQCIVTVAVLGSDIADEDDVQNAIVDLRRYIREARRAEQTGDTDDVYLQLQKDGATNAVNHRIKNGWVDDSQSHYIGARLNTDVAVDVRINLVLAPYGESTSTITLQNHMFSSPHFVEFSGGLAHGWNETGGGTVTPSISSSSWLIGGQGQAFIATSGASDQGLYCDTITCTTSNYIHGFVWVAANSAGNQDQVKIILKDGAGTALVSKTFNPTTPVGYDQTATDKGSNNYTWFRYSFIDDGSPVRGAANCFIQIVRASGDASNGITCFIDGTYLDVNPPTTTIPDAWMSSMAIDNRNDIQTTSQATENYLNYIDVWGVPGDAPALVQTQIKYSSLASNTNRIYIGRNTDGRILAADQIHWLESDEFTNAGGALTWSTGSGTSDNHYWHGAYSASVGSRYVTKSGDAGRALAAVQKRVYGLIRVNDITIRVSVQVNVGYNLFTSEDKTLNAINTWELVDFGLMNGMGVVTHDVPDTANPDVNFEIIFEDLGAGDTVDFDAFLLIPVDEFLITRAVSPAFTTADTWYIRPTYQDFLSDDRGHIEQGTLGSFWYLPPGNKTTRFIIASQLSSDRTFPLANQSTVTLTITPRTRHLLGTI